MNTVIKSFYEENNIPAVMLKQKLSKFEDHADIAAEFEYWIQNRRYVNENAISVEGYTAEALAGISEYLNGEGAFMMLIDLRENPGKALNQISRGFKRK